MGSALRYRDARIGFTSCNNALYSIVGRNVLYYSAPWPLFVLAYCICPAYASVTRPCLFPCDLVLRPCSVGATQPTNRLVHLHVGQLAYSLTNHSASSANLSLSDFYRLLYAAAISTSEVVPPPCRRYLVHAERLAGPACCAYFHCLHQQAPTNQGICQ